MGKRSEMGSNRKRKHRTRGILWAVVFVCALLILSGCALDEGDLHSENSVEVTDDLALHFLDVGQADCTVLVSKGEAMIIDTGNRDDAARIMGYLRQLGVERLKYMILTHTDEDHIGSSEAVLESMPVESVYVQKAYLTVTGEYLMKELKAKGLEPLEPKPGDEITLGDCRIQFVGPVKSYYTNDDNSICVRVSHGSIDALFTGDASIPQEEDMLDAGQKLEAELLQAGHHGSSKSNGNRLLREADPEYVVVSCGVNNDYDHPHQKTLNRINAIKAKVYRTDQQGTILAISDGKNLTFQTVSKDQMKEYTKAYRSEPYIGNMHSHKYHTKECDGLPEPVNRVYFRTWKEAQGAGYSPCSACQ